MMVRTDVTPALAGTLAPLQQVAGDVVIHSSVAQGIGPFFWLPRFRRLSPRLSPLGLGSALNVRYRDRAICCGTAWLVKVYGRRPSQVEREGRGAGVRKPPKQEPAGTGRRYGDLRILVERFRRCGDCATRYTIAARWWLRWRTEQQCHVASPDKAIWLSASRSRTC